MNAAQRNGVFAAARGARVASGPKTGAKTLLNKPAFSVGGVLGFRSGRRDGAGPRGRAGLGGRRVRVACAGAAERRSGGGGISFGDRRLAVRRPQLATGRPLRPSIWWAARRRSRLHPCRKRPRGQWRRASTGRWCRPHWSARTIDALGRGELTYKDESAKIAMATGERPLRW